MKPWVPGPVVTQEIITLCRYSFKPGVVVHTRNCDMERLRQENKLKIQKQSLSPSKHRRGKMSPSRFPAVYCLATFCDGMTACKIFFPHKKRWQSRWLQELSLPRVLMYSRSFSTPFSSAEKLSTGDTGNNLRTVRKELPPTPKDSEKGDH